MNNKGADQTACSHNEALPVIKLVVRIAEVFLSRAQPRACKEEEVSGFQDEVLEQILDFPMYSIHLNFFLSSKQGKVSQLMETFSHKLPPRLSPA